MMRSKITALFLGGLVAVAVFAGSTPVSPENVSSVQSCPLSLPQQLKAGQAFEKMMPVLKHPRCFNCHGGVNETLPAEDGGHLGGDVGTNDCLDCHVGVRNLNNSTRQWSTPPAPLFFKGRSSRDLCNQFKINTPNPELFIGHMINDNDDSQFAEAAYQGDRNLNAHGRAVSQEQTGHAMVPERPPVPHAQLVTYAREWANTVGAAGWKIPDCGCRIMGDRWEGTVTTEFTHVSAGYGTLKETQVATARFEIDSTFFHFLPGSDIPKDPWIVWKTTGGVLNWTVNATGGQCTTSASGSAPIILGGDGIPWGSIWIEPDSSTGDLKYSVQTGPWPDEYQPRFMYQCHNGDVNTSFPSNGYSFLGWWVHAPGATLVNGESLWGAPAADDRRGPSPLGTIKGSLTNTTELGTYKWVWDFKLVR
ncbi:MAG TPA: hypothetical protein VKD28_01640 [Gemmatimonadales bacterium]|nr:hypothetical protein [Gemmatimonadales bacterium]